MKTRPIGLFTNWINQDQFRPAMMINSWSRKNGKMCSDDDDVTTQTMTLLTQPRAKKFEPLN